MLYIAAALIIGFIAGAIEGRAAVARAREIANAASADVREAADAATKQLHAHIEAGMHDVALTYAHIVATLRGAL